MKDGKVQELDQLQLEALRGELESRVQEARTLRFNAAPEDVQRAVLRLVLTLVELIRQLLERQAIRRMDEGTLTSRQVEDVGLALLRLEETVQDLADQFGIPREELNLDLGPLGPLL